SRRRSARRFPRGLRAPATRWGSGRRASPVSTRSVRRMTDTTAAAAAPAISLRAVNREFRRPRTSLRTPPPVVHAVRDVTLDIQPGERFGLVGESGSGKTTLLKLISGLDHPTSGEILIEGQPIHDRSARQLGWLRRRLQLVFQDP